MLTTQSLWQKLRKQLRPYYIELNTNLINMRCNSTKTNASTYKWTQYTEYTLDKEVRSQYKLKLIT